MHNIELFNLARTQMEEYMCKQISYENFIYQAYCYAESFKGVEFKVKYEYDDLLEHDKMSDILQDYCIYVLAFQPEPSMTYVRNYQSQWH